MFSPFDHSIQAQYVLRPGVGTPRQRCWTALSYLEKAIWKRVLSQGSSAQSPPFPLYLPALIRDCHAPPAPPGPHPRPPGNAPVEGNYFGITGALLWHYLGTILAILGHYCGNTWALLWQHLGTIVATLGHYCGTT
jgi:hypothetical protein